jgi:hypothetical protein
LRAVDRFVDDRADNDDATIETFVRERTYSHCANRSHNNKCSAATIFSLPLWKSGVGTLFKINKTATVIFSNRVRLKPSHGGRLDQFATGQGEGPNVPRTNKTSVAYGSLFEGSFRVWTSRFNCNQIAVVANEQNLSLVNGKDLHSPFFDGVAAETLICAIIAPLISLGDTHSHLGL